jgi:hypothetical protein
LSQQLVPHAGAWLEQQALALGSTQWVPSPQQTLPQALPLGPVVHTLPSGWQRSRLGS